MTTARSASSKRPVEATKRSRSLNPPWLRDELILALDLYMRSPGALPSHSHPDTVRLSEQLQRLAETLGTAPGGTYRNVNGVYMKMMNFRRFDPTYADAGKVGLQRGNKDEAVVWAEFAADPDRLRATAAAILSGMEQATASGSSGAPDDAIPEAQEGRLLSVLHLRRERSRKLVDAKKQEVRRRTGQLRCEACGFDFEATYGERGADFIEVHHTVPLHAIGDPRSTKLDDLAVVCANCHRMIHARRDWLSMDDLKKLLVRVPSV